MTDLSDEILSRVSVEIACIAEIDELSTAF